MVRKHQLLSIYCVFILFERVLRIRASSHLRGVHSEDETQSITLANAPSKLDLDSLLDHRISRNAIAGGTIAQPTEAPFFAMMLTWSDRENKWVSMACGGSVISNMHILTSAHCFRRRDTSKDAVYVQAYEPFDGNKNVPFHFSRIKSCTMHHNFRDVANANDLAILTLSYPIQDTLSIPAIRLLRPDNMESKVIQPNVMDGDTVSIYGFGSVNDDSMAQSNTLRVAQLPFMSRSKCQEFFPYLLPDMICGDSSKRVDACRGDSGGPMVFKDDSGFVYQLGIVSWGVGCGQSRKPGVYTSITYHFKWIQDFVCSTNGVDQSIPLCSEDALQKSLPATTDISTVAMTGRNKLVEACGAGLKQTGARCFFGGECCSGLCSASSSGMRKCQPRQ